MKSLILKGLLGDHSMSLRENENKQILSEHQDLPANASNSTVRVYLSE